MTVRVRVRVGVRVRVRIRVRIGVRICSPPRVDSAAETVLVDNQITGDIGQGGSGSRKRHRPGKYLLEAVSPSIELNPLREIMDCWLNTEWNPELSVLGWRQAPPTIQ